MDFTPVTIKHMLQFGKKVNRQKKMEEMLVNDLSESTTNGCRF